MSYAFEQLRTLAEERLPDAFAPEGDAAFALALDEDADLVLAMDRGGRAGARHSRPWEVRLPAAHRIGTRLPFTNNLPAAQNTEKSEKRRHGVLG